MSAHFRNLAGTLALTSIAACGVDAQPHRFEVGRAVPDLVLPSAEDGSPRSLADYRGERLVLHVFASW